MVTATIQSNNPAAWLFANREHLSLQKATNYLVGRMRARTPLGAAEFLSMRSGLTPGVHGYGSPLLFARARELGPEPLRQMFDERVELSVTKMEIYREFFPLEYHASQSSAYSLQREHELYALIRARLFPLDEDLIAATPGMFLPAIPIQGSQQHDWENGCCSFDKLQTVFKLALVLSGRKGPAGWRQVGIDLEPAPPLAAEAWTLFAYALAVESTPLTFLIRAFNLTCYATGNPWLDAPRDNYVAVPWSAQNVALLAMARVSAIDLNHSVMILDRWLDEAPKERLTRAVELWNAAERQAGEGVRLLTRR